MRLSRTKKWVAGAVGVVVVGVFAAVALASLPMNFTTTTLVTANLTDAVRQNHDGIKFQTKDPTDVRVQKVDIAAGGFSGWHHHPGVVIVAVLSGSVNVSDSHCNQETYGPGLPNGSVFTEGGTDPGQVSSTTGATTYATLIAPHADPPVFRIEDNPPHCAS